METNKIMEKLEQAGTYAMQHGSEAIYIWGWSSLAFYAVLAVCGMIVAFIGTKMKGYNADFKWAFFVIGFLMALGAAAGTACEAVPRIMAPEGVLVYTTLTK